MDNLPAYHRLMADLYKFISYVLVVICRILCANLNLGAKTIIFLAQGKMRCGSWIWIAWMCRQCSTMLDSIIIMSKLVSEWFFTLFVKP